jgi:histidyl-tRNA synthetase
MGLGEFVVLDLSIVRGLAYYTGTVFELFDAARSMRAICGGGRYDTLLHSLGGPELPALGFGMGDVVLGELLRDRELQPSDESAVDVFLAGISSEDLPHLLALAHRLRDGGVRVEYALSPQSLGKQLKLADARNARLVVVLGPDERARGQLLIKDLRDGAQEPISAATAVDTIKARING